MKKKSDAYVKHIVFSYTIRGEERLSYANVRNVKGFLDKFEELEYSPKTKRYAKSRNKKILSSRVL